MYIMSLEEVFSFRKKEGFEFSHSPEHAFTSGVIYCSKVEIFSDTPHRVSQRTKRGTRRFI